MKGVTWSVSFWVAMFTKLCHECVHRDGLRHAILKISPQETKNFARGYIWVGTPLMLLMYNDKQ